jgi:hypothetical protein
LHSPRGLHDHPANLTSNDIRTLALEERHLPPTGGADPMNPTDPRRNQPFAADHTRICRNEYFLPAHIYAPHGILTHGLPTLSAVTV